MSSDILSIAKHWFAFFFSISFIIISLSDSTDINSSYTESIAQFTDEIKVVKFSLDSLKESKQL